MIIKIDIEDMISIAEAALLSSRLIYDKELKTGNSISVNGINARFTQVSRAGNIFIDVRRKK